MRMWWKRQMWVFKADAVWVKLWDSSSKTWSGLQSCLQEHMGCNTTILHAGLVKASGTVKNHEEVVGRETEVQVVLTGDPAWLALGARALLMGATPKSGLGYYEWPAFGSPFQSSWMARKLWSQDAKKNPRGATCDKSAWDWDSMAPCGPTVFGGVGVGGFPPPPPPSSGLDPGPASGPDKAEVECQVQGQWCRACETRGCDLQVTLVCGTCGGRSLFLERHYSPMAALDFVDVDTLSCLRVCCPGCEGLDVGPGAAGSLVPPRFLLPVVELKCGRQVRAMAGAFPSSKPIGVAVPGVSSLAAGNPGDQKKYIHMAVSLLLKLRLPEEAPLVGAVFVQSPCPSVTTLGPPTATVAPSGHKYVRPGFLG